MEQATSSQDTPQEDYYARGRTSRERPARRSRVGMAAFQAAQATAQAADVVMIEIDEEKGGSSVTLSSG